MLDEILIEAEKAQPLKSQKVIYENFFDLFCTELKVLSGDVLEIGAYMGKTSIFLSLLCQKLCNGKKVYSIDPFTEETMAKGHDQWNSTIYNHFFEHTRRLENHLHIRKPSSEAAIFFPDNSICFAFIDGDHSYEGVINDFQNYLPKMVLGGIMCFDDYRNSRWPGVGKAVNAISKHKNVDFFKGEIKEIYFRVLP